MNIETETVINVNIVDVWDVLSNFKSYHQWNPYIYKVESLDEGAKNLLVSAKIMGDKEMKLQTKMMEWRLGSRFAWQGNIFNLPWLLAFSHYFYLRQVSYNETKCIIGIEFSGVMSSYVGSRLAPYLAHSLGAMQQALKGKCEKNALTQAA